MSEEPGSNYVANQKKWMSDLEAFLKEFPKSDEAPEALLQLGSANEFNAEEDKAREDYAKLVQAFPDSHRRQEGRRRICDGSTWSASRSPSRGPASRARRSTPPSFKARRSWSSSGPRGAASRSAARSPTS